MVGKTGCGKTARAFAVAERLGKKMVHLQMAGRLPEDISGLPKVKNGVTEWSLPEWAKKAIDEPCLLFIDEFDKAPRECSEVILTLLAEGRLREHYLHPETDILLAMQPVSPDEFLADETGEALAARLLFIPVKYEWEFLENRWGVDLSGLARNTQIETPVLPEPSARQIDWALSWMMEHPQKEWGVLNYFLPGDVVAYLEEAMGGRNIKGEDIAQAVRKNPALIETLTIPELVTVGADIMQQCNSEIVCKMIEKVWVEGNEDDAQAMLNKVYNELYERCEKNGGEIEILDGDDEEVFRETLNETLQRIGEKWEEKSQAKNEAIVI